MNRIDEEEDNTDISAVIATVDQFPSIQPSPQPDSDSIYSSKQTKNKNHRSKYQTANRPTSLSPTRHLPSSNGNVIRDVKPRRRHASASNTNHITTIPTSLVVSFLRHLRNELRATTDRKNDYHLQLKQKSSDESNTTATALMNSPLSNVNILDPNDDNEILTLIDLLVLRVECLANETRLNPRKKKNDHCLTVAEVDRNLIEYLYYLFTKFVNDETNASNVLRIPIIDKNNFVNVCQTLVRNGCFDIPSTTLSISPDQSSSETINSSDKTLTQQALVREYHPDTDTMMAEKSSIDGENLSTTSAEQETWLVVDLEENQLEESIATSEATCQLPLSPSDEQLLIANDNYRSFESESSPSVYLSPNSSSLDLQNMVQELDDVNNPLSTSCNQDGSLSTVNIESKITISNDLSNNHTPLNNHIETQSTNDDSAIQTSEQLTMTSTDKMSRRQKKMHERWSVSTKTDKNDNDQSPAKTLLTVEFPPIAVLRRKYPPSSSSSSSSPTTIKKEQNEIETNVDVKLDLNPTVKVEEINTSPTIIMVKQTNPDQIVALSSEDAIMTDVGKNNHDEQLPLTVSEVICLSDEEIIMSEKQGPLLSTSLECHTETITNVNNNNLVDNQATNGENCSAVITNPSDSNLMSSSSLPSLISITPPPSSLTLTTDENKTIEPLSKEKDEEKTEEEQRCNDDYNVDEEKKNISSFVHDYHASGIILINDEPAQTALLHQEKKEKEEEEEERERPSSPLPPLEQFNQQRTEDESPVQTLSSDLNQMVMANIDENEERYKKVEIEEIPDDEEVISTQNVASIEPTDYIHTDDEPKKSKQASPQSNTTTIDDDSLKFDNVFQCYEKALSNVVDTHDESTQPSNTLAKESLVTNQEPANDPIALRALQRFEERMNAAAAAVKLTKDEVNPLVAKGKSPWSTSLSTSRKSLENLLKDDDQQLRSTAISLGEQSKTVTPSSQSDSYIRPRKTFDDTNLNYGTTINLYSTTSSTTNKPNNDDEKLEQEQEQQPAAIVDNDDQRVVDNKSTISVDLKDQQDEEKQEIITESIDTTESELVNEAENSDAPSITLTDNSIINSSLDTVVSQSSLTDQVAFTPYRFQIEGRRRLNTVERMRERQSREPSDATEQLQQQIQNDYTLRPEEVQDPIIRRALERFDEKNRTLTQTKSMNYDEIQDPVTRRALMRLESNLKRTLPPTTNDSNEPWYTESYTLGSLQPTSDRLSRYSDSLQASTVNNKAKYVSVHPRYSSSSSAERSDLSTINNLNSTMEHNIPVMRVPAQPIYVTSNNLSQQQSQPLSLRQRSRSEDMLTSRDLIIGQTTNLDDIDTQNQLQRNRSSNEIAVNEPDFLLPNTLIKTLEPNFVRTTESSVTYATPTQSYSAYSCEYTRPRRNLGLTSSSETATALNHESSQLPPKYSPVNDVQRPTAYRPSIENQYQPQSSSAFAPVRSSTTATATTTTANNYYSQQSLPTPSYSSTYASNNVNPTPYSEDPIVRRALERFNSHLQNSLLSTSQYQPMNNYSSHQGNFQDNWTHSNRPTLMTTSTSSSSNNSVGGYQSIIGRRRQTRHDDLNNSYIDNTSIGDGYSSSLFSNAHNPYSVTNQYRDISDEPPAVPPRFRRETYRNDDLNDQYRRHSIDEYLSENINNNNNNNSSQTLPRETFIHHAYPATITNSTGFRPIDIHYSQQFDAYHQVSNEQDELRDRAQSPESTHSSDSAKQQQHQRPIRPNHIRTQMTNVQRLPPSSISTRTNTHPMERKTNEHMITNKISPDNSQSLSGQTLQNNGNVVSDSVFHRLAYTGTKASLSKTSSNSCSNLLNKNASQLPVNQLKSCEIDFEESTQTMETNDNNEQISALASKCQRSKSVDGRARLKIGQGRMSSNQTITDNDENDLDDEQKIVPSSKFIPVNGRRDGAPPRVPLTPTSGYRTSSLKRPANGTNFAYIKDNPGIRTQSYNGNALDSDNQQQDMENDENISYNDDNYQPKIIDNRLRTAIPVHRYTVNNNQIQASPSVSSVTHTPSRIKPPSSIPISLEKRDSSTAITEINRTPRRSDDYRRPSPPGQRRNVPVSVFSPAKLDNKRPAPAPPTYNYESQQQVSYSVRLPTNDNSYPSKLNEHELESKISSPPSSTTTDLKSSTSNLVVNEFTLTTDKHDHSNNKKMNVFERLFRGNKKKN